MFYLAWLSCPRLPVCNGVNINVKKMMIVVQLQLIRGLSDLMRCCFCPPDCPGLSMKNKELKQSVTRVYSVLLLLGYSGLSQLLKFLDIGTLMIVIYSFLSLWVFDPGH